MIIGVDFDGTCVESMYPDIGVTVPYAVSSLLRLVSQGHKLILYTMRSNMGDQKELTDATNWFKMNGIELWGVQANPDQHAWTESPKPYANIYIDDKAVGCPLRPGIANPDMHMVDWLRVMNMMSIFN
jgi:hypothetical protein